MSNFKHFKSAVQKQFERMAQYDVLFLTDVSRDDLWDNYLSAYPGETGENVESEAQGHNCNCCKQFVRPFANIVAIDPQTLELVTLWDNMQEHGLTEDMYLEVAKEMREKVLSSPIANVFINDFAKLGTDSNNAMLEDGTVVTWNHFHLVLPSKFVLGKGYTSIESFQGGIRDSKNVFKRSLDEITQDAIETTLELIDQGSIYRGQEFKSILTLFLKMKKEYDSIPEERKDNYCWLNSRNNPAAKIRNNAIGTLLTDISEGRDLEEAVKAFERIMAPTNYKRPNAIFTKKMLEEAKAKVEELGLMGSLGRRFAIAEDITINNVLFANRDVRERMQGNDPFEDMASDVTVNPRSLDRVEEINIEDFLSNVLPKVNNIELLVENRHEPNFFSLIAPKDKQSPSLFKWPSGFSWEYNGGVTDSIKEQVRQAGGRVDGVLRASLSWFNYDDLDLHAREPSGNHIYFSNKKSSITGGNLDVDMNAGSGQTRKAVENIIWPKKSKLENGIYTISVHQYNRRENKDVGFVCEIEFNNTIHTFEYKEAVRGTVDVATVTYKNGEFSIKGLIPSTSSSRDIWGVATQQFHPVSMAMFSPNHWDDNSIGNKHYMFVLNNCKNPGNPRGFFNEFVKEEFTPHRKVFEALGSKMKVADSDNQLSGLGFSSTQRNNIIVKVSGNFTRTLKITF